MDCLLSNLTINLSRLLTDTARHGIIVIKYKSLSLKDWDYYLGKGIF